MIIHLIKYRLQERPKYTQMTKIPWKPLTYAHKFASYYYNHYLCIIFVIII